MKRFPLPDELTLPTRDEILEMHDVQLERYGGKPGFNEQKIIGIDAVLGRVRHHIDYADAPDLLSAVAILWHGLTQAHAFLDGNKRTALMTMAVTLEMNGVTYDRGGEYAANYIELLFAEAGESTIELQAFEANLWQNTRALDYHHLTAHAPEGPDPTGTKDT